MSDTTISHQPQGHVFVLERAGKRLGHLDYALTGKVMTIDYVEVDRSLRGSGMGTGWWTPRSLGRARASWKYRRAVLSLEPS